MRATLFVAFCTFSINEAEAALSHGANAEKGRARVQEHLRSEGDYDRLFSDVAELQQQAEVARSQNSQRALGVVHDLRMKAIASYGPSVATIEQDKSIVNQEKSTVDGTDSQTVQLYELARSTALEEKKKIDGFQARAEELTNNVRTHVSDTTHLMRTGTEMLFLQDWGSFAAAKEVVKGKVDAKVLKLSQKINTEKIKERADNKKSKSKQRTFIESLADHQVVALNQINDAKTLLSDGKKSLGNAVDSVDRTVREAQAAINRIPQGDKVITTRDFHSYIGDTEDDVSDQLDDATEQVEDKFKFIDQAGKKLYDEIKVDAETHGTEMVSEIRAAIGEEDKEISEKVAEAKRIKVKARQIATNVGVSTTQLESDVGVWTSDLNVKEKENLRDLDRMSESEIENLKTDLTKEKDNTERLGQILTTAIADEVGDTSEAVTDKVQVLDAIAQKEVMDGSSDETTMRSFVNGEQMKVKSLLRRSSQVSAGIKTAEKDAATKLKLVGEKRDQHVFEMELAKAQLDQDVKLGVQNYDVTSEGVLSKLMSSAARLVPDLESQTWPQLKTMLVGLAEHLAGEKSAQMSSLAKLQHQLKTVQEQLRRFGSDDQMTTVEVPMTIASAETDLTAMHSWLLNLAKSRSRIKTKVERKMFTDIQDGKNWDSIQKATVKRKVNNEMSDIARKYITEIGKETGSLQKVQGDNLANEHVLDEAREFLEKRIEALTTELFNENTILANSQRSVNGELNYMTGAKQAQLEYTAKQETSKAVAAMETKESVAKATENALLSEEDQKAIARLEDLSEKSQGALADLGSGGVAVLEKIVAALVEDLRAAEGASQENGLAAGKAAEEHQAGMADVLRASQSSLAQSLAVGESARTSAAQMKEKKKRLNDNALTETAAHLDSAVFETGSAERKAELELLRLLDSVAKGSEAHFSTQQQGLRKEKQAVDAEQYEVDQAVSSAQKGLAGAAQSYDQASEQAGEAVESVQSLEKQATEGASDDLEVLEQYKLSATMRGGAVLSTLDQEANDLLEQTAASATRIMDNTTAQAEYIEAGNVAAYSGVDSAIANAADSEGSAEAGMARAESSLHKVATELEAHKERYENFTQTKGAGFRKRADEEEVQMQGDLDYLDKYSRTTHLKELNLLDTAVALLGSQAGQSDQTMDTIEMEEFKLAQQVGDLLGSEEFKTLKKVMETDKYVQSVTVDDENLVNYFTHREEREIPWMKSVLEGLGEAHQAKLEHEAALVAYSKDEDAKAAAKMSGAVTSLETEAEEAETLPVAELSSQLGGSVELLNAKTTQEGKESQEQLDELERDDMLLGAKQGKQYDNMKRSFATTQKAVGSVAGLVDHMTADLQKLLNYNDKVVSLERQRLNGAAQKMSDRVFYSTLGVPAPGGKDAGQTDKPQAGAGKSLAELDGGEDEADKQSLEELDAVLAQNQQLSALVHGLSKKHEELQGEVVSHLRDHHISVNLRGGDGRRRD